jgi:RNA polymerase sigma factor (sigma-70 family)
MTSEQFRNEFIGSMTSEQFRNEFIEEHFPYLEKISWRMRQPLNLREDTLAEVAAALVSLLDKADDARRTKLTENKKYRNRVFSNLFKDAFAKLIGQNNLQEKSEVNRPSLSKVTKSGGEFGDLAQCGRLNPEKILALAEENTKLQRAFDLLQADEMAVVDLTFGLGGEELGQKEIAARLHISQGRVSQLLKSGLQRMRESRIIQMHHLRNTGANFSFNGRSNTKSSLSELDDPNSVEGRAA